MKSISKSNPRSAVMASERIAISLQAAAGAFCNRRRGRKKLRQGVHERGARTFGGCLSCDARTCAARLDHLFPQAAPQCTGALLSMTKSRINTVARHLRCRGDIKEAPELDVVWRGALQERAQQFQVHNDRAQLCTPRYSAVPFGGRGSIGSQKNLHGSTSATSKYLVQLIAFLVHADWPQRKRVQQAAVGLGNASLVVILLSLLQGASCYWSKDGKWIAGNDHEHWHDGHLGEFYKKPREKFGESA